MSTDATTFPLPGTLVAGPAVATRERSARRTRVLTVTAAVALLAMVAVSALVVVVAANRPSFLVPPSAQHWFPHWLAGPLGGLWPQFTRNTATLQKLFTYGMLGLYAAYALALVCVPHLRARWTIAALIALHIVFFLSPPLALTDIFNYINYGRMEIVNHLNPYATTPWLEPHTDPAYAMSNWHHLLSPYGPMFTVLTFALVPLGVAGSFWVMKGILLLTSLGLLGLVWASARLLARDPVRAVAFVGLNPIVLLWGLGGDHNDFITVFLIMLAFYLLLRARVRAGESVAASEISPASHWTLPGAIGRSRLSAARGRLIAVARAKAVALGPRRVAVAQGVPGPVGAMAPLRPEPLRSGESLSLAEPDSAVVSAPRGRVRAWLWPPAPAELMAGVALVAGVSMKASAAVLIPVALLGHGRTPRRLAQMLVGMVVTAVVAGIVSYIAFGAHIPDLSTQNRLITAESLPNLLGLALGQGGETATLHTIVQSTLVLSVLAASAWAWRRRRLITPAGWATVALLFTLSWLLPWYVLWLLPLAALARSRALKAVALVFGLYLILVWVPLAGDWYRLVHFSPASTPLGQAHQRETKFLLH